MTALTENYLSLVLGLQNITPEGALSTIFLTLARILPIVAIVPFFGARSLPTTIKMLFSLSLCAILFPQNLLLLQKEILFSSAFIFLLFKELFIGFILAFIASIPFFVAQSSGNLIDHIRGSSALQVTDPTTNVQTGPVGVLYNYTLIAVFFIVGGPLLFLDAVSNSYQLIPVDQYINPAFFNLKVPLWQTILHLLNHILNLSIQLGAPSIIGILMGEMFLGIANRLAPQVQIVFLGFSLKSWVGLALLAAAWYFIMGQLGKESLTWVKTINKLLQDIAPVIKGS